MRQEPEERVNGGLSHGQMGKGADRQAGTR